MTFGGSPHSAEKVQHDINSILDAIAQMLAKVRLQELAEEEKLEQVPPLLEDHRRVDPSWVSITELDDEQKRLTGHDPRLLPLLR